MATGAAHSRSAAPCQPSRRRCCSCSRPLSCSPPRTQFTIPEPICSSRTGREGHRPGARPIRRRAPHRREITAALIGRSDPAFNDPDRSARREAGAGHRDHLITSPASGVTVIAGATEADTGGVAPATAGGVVVSLVGGTVLGLVVLGDGEASEPPA